MIFHMLRVKVQTQIKIFIIQDGESTWQLPQTGTAAVHCFSNGVILKMHQFGRRCGYTLINVYLQVQYFSH